MKRSAQLAFISALTISGAAFGQGGDMKGMDMMKQKTPGNQVHGTARQAMVHKTSAVVKAVDPVNGKVTLAHEPVKTLNWPAMTMTFGVKDKALLDKLAVGKKVDVEFTQQGSNYIVSAVK